MASKYEKQANKFYDPLEKEALAENKKKWQQQAQDARKVYDTQIFEAGRAYEDQYRDNAVQKAINERQVAESMANMGLTDSGLNRTQQTAIALSSANNKAAIDRQRQQAIDSLELQKTSDLSSIRQGYLSDQASIKQSYDQAKATYASDLYKTAVSNASKTGSGTKNYAGGNIYNNGATISRNMQGTLKDNNITIMAQKDADGFVTGYKYVDNNTGKYTVVPVGVNPYTGEDNYSKYSAVAKSANDFFENGYQPKKVYVNGVNYGYVRENNGETAFINGVNQRVHKTINNGEVRYWMWDRNNNTYIEVFINPKGEWEEKVN